MAAATACQLHTFLSILLHSASETNALKPKSPDDFELLLAWSSAGSAAAAAGAAADRMQQHACT
jgi:hypothetical protein